MIIIERVKFYSIEDMSIDDNFNLAIKFIKNLDSNKKDYEINDILEMFNILKLFQNVEHFNNYNQKYTQKYQKFPVFTDVFTMYQNVYQMLILVPLFD